MSDVTKKLLNLYNNRRTLRAGSTGTGDDEQLWAYRKAAAVLHTFYPADLKPVSGPVHENPQLLLFDDIVYTSGELSRRLFTLKPAVRKETLKRFSSRDAMLEALAANPVRQMTPLQMMWEEYLNKGAMPPAEQMGYAELTCFYQILCWLDGMDANLQSLASVQELLQRKSVLSGFEHLVIKNFTGRVTELDMLRMHIGVSPPAATSGIVVSIQKMLDWLGSPQQKPILSIYGVGGMGKSALVGYVLYEQAQLQDPDRLRFAYLAFDRPTIEVFDQPDLRPDTPFTLLVEAAAQLSLQCPQHASAFAAFNEKVREFRTKKSAISDREEVSYTRGLRVLEQQSLESELYGAFADLLHIICTPSGKSSAEKIPMLLALDTFEEVQYHDREKLKGLWDMLEEVGVKFPPFRVIITGRASIADLGIKPYYLREAKLEELKPADRVALLERLGVPDPEIRQAVAQQVGGSPLSLHLAANLITSDIKAAGPKGIKDLTTQWLFIRVDQQIIQGRLYRRILDHIHNPEVRKLAHPGMLLRVVSPEVILKVLAPVCGIPITTLNEARVLFEELKREHALVKMGNSGTLEYRPEIREGVVRLLSRDKFSAARELHRSAIEYYQTKDDPSSRAEEMYHRLVLDEDQYWTLDERFIAGIEQSLVRNMAEYPDRAVRWLGSRAGVEVPREIYRNADIADWERNITRKVKLALTRNSYTEALHLLRERNERTVNSPLFALEAKAHLLQMNVEKAGAVLAAGIETVSGSTNMGRLAELYWLQSQVSLLQEDPSGADVWLERAEQSVEQAVSPQALMHVLCHRIMLRIHYPRSYAQNIAALRAKLNTACDRVDLSAAYDMEFVLSLALFLLGDEFPKTANRLSGVGKQIYAAPASMLTTENLRGLEEFRESWEDEGNRFFESLV
ncbi:MAG TPA: hypothetical protein VD996_12685 [Chitinophagaceae bacterium]|nr:hypothetical protein [Chitinophagaceae bacterium]